MLCVFSLWHPLWLKDLDISVCKIEQGEGTATGRYSQARALVGAAKTVLSFSSYFGMQTYESTEEEEASSECLESQTNVGKYECVFQVGCCSSDHGSCWFVPPFYSRPTIQEYGPSRRVTP